MAGSTRRGAKVLTVSDSVHAGSADDLSGSALSVHLEEWGFEVVERRVVPDEAASIERALRALVADFVGLVVTSGGTGFAPRDLTPEATLCVLEREAPGLAEAMRLVNPLGRLSRSVAGTVGACVVLNTPGSPAGAVECLEAVIDVLPHALDLLTGANPHPHRAR